MRRVRARAVGLASRDDLLARARPNGGAASVQFAVPPLLAAYDSTIPIAHAPAARSPRRVRILERFRLAFLRHQARAARCDSGVHTVGQLDAADVQRFSFAGPDRWAGIRFPGSCGTQLTAAAASNNVMGITRPCFRPFSAPARSPFGQAHPCLHLREAIDFVQREHAVAPSEGGALGDVEHLLDARVGGVGS